MCFKNFGFTCTDIIFKFNKVKSIHYLFQLMHRWLQLTSKLINNYFKHFPTQP